MTNGEKVMETFPGGETKRGYYGINSLPLVIVTFGTIVEGYEMAFLESCGTLNTRSLHLSPSGLTHAILKRIPTARKQAVTKEAALAN